MICPAVLRVVAGEGFFSKTFLVSCVKQKPHKPGKNCEPDIASLPLKFGGTAGTWVVKIKV